MTAKQRGAVFHIDSTLTWKLLLANVENLLNGWEGPLYVEVVGNGPEVQGLTRQSETRSKVEHLSAKGIRFLACSNSLPAHRIPSEQLLPQAEVVAAAVVHLTARQLRGWAYIKP